MSEQLDMFEDGAIQFDKVISRSVYQYSETINAMEVDRVYVFTPEHDKFFRLAMRRHKREGKVFTKNRNVYVEVFK